MRLLNTDKVRKHRRRSSGPGRCSALLLSLCLLTATAGSTVQAADASNRQQAIDMAMRQNGGQGKVLGVQVIRAENGQSYFAVKILSNGRVRVHRIPQSR